MSAYLAVLFVICTVSVTEVFGEASVKITKGDVEAIDNEYYKMDVKVRQEGGKSLVDIDADQLQDINDDVFMQVVIDKMIGGSYVTMYKSDVINRCHFTENRDKFPVEKALTDDFEKYGNLLHNCPMKKGHYYLKGFQFEPRGVLMEKIANGEFRIHFILMREIGTQMKTLLSMRWYSVIN